MAKLKNPTLAVERLKRKVQYLRTLLKITQDERDWYADLAGDDAVGDCRPDELKALDEIQWRYNNLGKEPRA